MGRSELLQLILLFVALLLGGCGELTPPGERHDGYYPPQSSVDTSGYTVRPGDTLYSIAWGAGLDVREVAAWNNIPPPFTIYPGQYIALVAPRGYSTPQPSSRTPPPPPPTKPKRQPTTVASAPARASKPARPAPKSSPSRSRSPSASAKGSSRNRNTPSPSRPVRGKTAKPSAQAPLAVNKAAPKLKSPAPVADNGSKAISVSAEKVPTSSLSKVEKGESSPNLTRGNWRWPTQGKVVRRFDADSGRKGIDINGQTGQGVFTAAAGDVVYSGDGLLGYGNLIIIKHDDIFLSAYGHNSQLLVKEGDKVAAGQKIAEMGVSPKEGAILHFEIRKEGKPVDPLAYLP